MRVDDLKYFQTRSKPVLRKMLLLIKRSNVYGLLTVKLPIYLTFVNLPHMLNVTILTKRKWRQILLIAQIFQKFFT